MAKTKTNSKGNNTVLRAKIEASKQGPGIADHEYARRLAKVDPDAYVDTRTEGHKLGQMIMDHKAARASMDEEAMSNKESRKTYKHGGKVSARPGKIKARGAGCATRGTSFRN